MDKHNPVAEIVSRIVERDDIQRARIIVEIDRRKSAGGEGWQTDEEVSEQGLNWKQFLIAFSDRYPWLALFFPVAVLLYLAAFYQMIGG